MHGGDAAAATQWAAMEKTVPMVLLTSGHMLVDVLQPDFPFAPVKMTGSWGAFSCTVL